MMKPVNTKTNRNQAMKAHVAKQQKFARLNAYAKRISQIKVAK